MAAAVASSTASGQDHDRFGGSDSLHSHTMVSTKPDLDVGSVDADITPFQKMLSATTGSLLTGLTSTFEALAMLFLYSLDTLRSGH